MSQLSTHRLNIAPSRLYTRTLNSLTLISFLFIYYSSTYFFIKAILGIALIYHYVKTDKRFPCPQFAALHVCLLGHHIELLHEQIIPVKDLKVLIHNPLFQLIKISYEERNQIIVIFNDQLTPNQLQLLHVKTIKTTWKKLRFLKPMIK